MKLKLWRNLSRLELWCDKVYRTVCVPYKNIAHKIFFLILQNGDPLNY